MINQKLQDFEEEVKATGEIITQVRYLCFVHTVYFVEFNSCILNILVAISRFLMDVKFFFVHSTFMYLYSVAILAHFWLCKYYFLLLLRIMLSLYILYSYKTVRQFDRS